MGEVSTEDGKIQPVTVIAYTNMELLEFAMNLMAKGSEEEDGEIEEDIKVIKKARKNKVNSKSTKKEKSVKKEIEETASKLPVFDYKIALYGKV